MMKSQTGKPAETASPATCPTLPLVDDETLDTFLQEASNIERLPVRPEGYRREFQRMIVSAFLYSEAA
ncbi:MAG TPA: hypothetical protein VHD34_08750 [Xanthobacteraceae bacterium]|nr:hypothetical protein [Xanthobacteraceae bacterium]